MDMKAGRELDARVAEHVMGWRIDPGLPDETAFLYPPEWNDELGAWPSTCDRQQKGAHDLVPHYSTIIADAWKVVEKFDEFYLEITRAKQECFAMAGGNMDDAIVRDSMPLAICLSALKAVGYED